MRRPRRNRINQILQAWMGIIWRPALGNFQATKMLSQHRFMNHLISNLSFRVWRMIVACFRKTCSVARQTKKETTWRMNCKKSCSQSSSNSLVWQRTDSICFQLLSRHIQCLSRGRRSKAALRGDLSARRKGSSSLHRLTRVKGRKLTTSLSIRRCATMRLSCQPWRRSIRASRDIMRALSTGIRWGRVSCLQVLSSKRCHIRSTYSTRKLVVVSTTLEAVRWWSKHNRLAAKTNNSKFKVKRSLRRLDLKSLWVLLWCTKSSNRGTRKVSRQ